MPTIAELGLSLCTTTVEINGKPLAVRAVSVSEMSRLRSVLTRPVPPLGPDPSKGSAAAWVPDENDAEYQAKMGDYLRSVSLLKAAVAIDYTAPTGLGPDPVRWSPRLAGVALVEWCRSAESELGDVLTDRQVHAINEAADEGGARAAREAEKN